jgi:predicted transcriptional regulator
MAPDPNAQPTRPELAVLKLLWNARWLTAREIADVVGAEFAWSYSTVRTVLERMCDKDLLTKKYVDGVNLYAARVGKIALLTGMIRDFTDRVLEIDAAPSAAMFADSKLLTKDEIEELERALAAARTDGGKA